MIGCLTSSISIIKFDADRAPKESNLIWFFWEVLIRARQLGRISQKND